MRTIFFAVCLAHEHMGITFFNSIFTPYQVLERQICVGISQAADMMRVVCVKCSAVVIIGCCL